VFKPFNPELGKLQIQHLGRGERSAFSLKES